MKQFTEVLKENIESRIDNVEYLRIKNWDVEEYPGTDGYFNISIIKENRQCIVSTQRFEVTSVNGYIFVHEIDAINEALTEVKRYKDELVNVLKGGSVSEYK